MSNRTLAHRLLAIGDSLTCGFPYPPDCSWVNLVSRQLRILIINRGICGETAGDMLGRFAAEISAHKATAVIITGGSNDAYSGVGVREFREQMAAMLEHARGSGLAPVIGLPPPIIGREEARLAEYRSSLRLLATEFAASILDFYSPFIDAPSGKVRTGLFVDGVHPSLDGYAVMAEAARPSLAGLIYGAERKR